MSARVAGEVPAPGSVPRARGQPCPLPARGRGRGGSPTVRCAPAPRAARLFVLSWGSSAAAGSPEPKGRAPSAPSPGRHSSCSDNPFCRGHLVSSCSPRYPCPWLGRKLSFGDTPLSWAFRARVPQATRVAVWWPSCCESGGRRVCMCPHSHPLYSGWLDLGRAGRQAGTLRVSLLSISGHWSVSAAEPNI